MTSRDVAVLRALREQVRTAPGADDDLDADLMVGLGVLTRSNQMAEWPDEEPIWHYTDPKRRVSGAHHPMVWNCTDSIDAALALLNRALPGCEWKLEADYCWLRWMGAKDVEEAQGGFLGRDGEATALAICFALLSVLIARSETGHAP